MRRLLWDQKRAKRDKRYRRRIFAGFVRILERAKIYKNKDLRLPEDKRRRASGFCVFDVAGRAGPYLIYVNPRLGLAGGKKEKAIILETEVLIHELFHVLFPDVCERSGDRTAENGMKILMAAFTEAQREILHDYVPRRCTTRQVWDDE